MGEVRRALILRPVYTPCHAVRCSVSSVNGGGLLHPSAHLDVGNHLNVAKALRSTVFAESGS
jgi:hypothetical protein